MHKIDKPTNITYFIAYCTTAESTKEPISFGIVTNENCMETGLDNIETFIEKDQFLQRCEEIGIEAFFITYNILENGDKNPLVYGSVEGTNYLDEGLDNIETFIYKDEYLKRCEELGIEGLEE